MERELQPGTKVTCSKRIQPCIYIYETFIIERYNFFASSVSLIISLNQLADKFIIKQLAIRLRSIYILYTYFVPLDCLSRSYKIVKKFLHSFEPWNNIKHCLA